jgi:YVTN family beta-propeller protein
MTARFFACIASALLAIPVFAPAKTPAPAPKPAPKPAPAKPPVKPAKPAAPSTPSAEKMGKVSDTRWITPTNQVITPAGRAVELYGLRPQALALSPDGRLLATAGRTAELIIIDPTSGKVLQKVPLPPEKPADLKGTGKPTGTQQSGVLGPQSTSPATNPVADPKTSPATSPAPKPADPKPAPETSPAPKPSTDPKTSPETNPATPASAEQKPATAAGTPKAPPDPVDKTGQLSFTGLIFSPDGSRIFLSNVNGNIKEFTVAKDGKVSPKRNIPLPEAKAPKRKNDIPAGLAVSPDGRLLYVCLNLGNRLGEVEIESGKTLRTIDVGVAPYDVVLLGDKAYVSNWGGRRPGPKDLTGPAGRGTLVRVDPERFIASEGSVSIIDLKTGKVLNELLTGKHACAMALSPDGKHLVVCNAGDDTLSVINTETDQIIEKIWTRPTPADLFGAQPNALAFEKDGDWLFVANGTHNAIAVIEFEPGASKFEGLIPVGWFPGAVVFDAARKQLAIANIKGFGSQKILKPGDKPKYNSKEFFGTLSLVPVPKKAELEKHTAVAEINMRYSMLKDAALPARPDVAPRPVPERVGEPSVFKHVLYIIKENRTYDQVLGDVKEGNGDPSLCIFGEKYTPNQHKLVREFVLLDNTYCSGIQSADGHQWSDSAFATDYVERSHAGWPRSYMNLKTEDAMDALAYSPAGFLWDNALKHGKTVRDYGEACISDSRWTDSKMKDKPAWRDFYDDWKNKTSRTKIACKPGIESLRKIAHLDTVGWDMNVPDVVRAQAFIDDLRDWEGIGKLPNLMIMLLPNDHTGGTRGKAPTPAAQVADNDLAMGMIVEALSRSRFWPETCIFAIEDDPQNGFDHVSGYRTTAYVASPYNRRGATVSTQYNQTSLIRTIELILGLPPMNLLDATATPMFDVFTDAADLTPFVAVANQVPLDQTNPEKKEIKDPILKSDEEKSSAINFNEPDRAPEDVLNRILWHAQMGTRVPYPDWAVHLVEDDDD